jgi:hypothetical protein
MGRPKSGRTAPKGGRSVISRFGGSDTPKPVEKAPEKIEATSDKPVTVAPPSQPIAPTRQVSSRMPVTKPKPAVGGWRTAGLNTPSAPVQLPEGAERIGPIKLGQNKPDKRKNNGL